MYSEGPVCLLLLNGHFVMGLEINQCIQSLRDVLGLLTLQQKLLNSKLVHLFRLADVFLMQHSHFYSREGSEHLPPLWLNDQFTDVHGSNY